MKNPLQSFIEFPLTIRCLADRQDVSDAGVETGFGQAYFNSLNLLGRCQKSDTTNFQSFHPEHVLCSLSSAAAWKADTHSKQYIPVVLAIEPDAYERESSWRLHWTARVATGPLNSGNKERVFCSLSAGVVCRPCLDGCNQLINSLRPTPVQKQGTVNPFTRVRANEASESRPQHSENKETIGQRSLIQRKQSRTITNLKPVKSAWMKAGDSRDTSGARVPRIYESYCWQLRYLTIPDRQRKRTASVSKDEHSSASCELVGILKADNASVKQVASDFKNPSLIGGLSFLISFYPDRGEEQRGTCR